MEAAYVRLHGRNSGAERGWGMPEGIPKLLGQDHRIRQRPSGAVHQFHCRQAKGFLSPFFTNLAPAPQI